MGKILDNVFFNSYHREIVATVVVLLFSLFIRFVISTLVGKIWEKVGLFEAENQAGSEIHRFSDKYFYNPDFGSSLGSGAKTGVSSDFIYFYCDRRGDVCPMVYFE